MAKVLSIIILFLLFSNPLGRILPTNYIDEILCIVISFIALIKIIHHKIFAISFKIFFLTLTIILIGTFSTFLGKYQTDFIPIIKDLFNLVKVPFTFMFGIYLFKTKYINNTIKILIPIIKFLTIIIFLFGVLNLFFDLNMDCGYRNGIKTYQFLFTHPTFLVYTIVIFICVLCFESHFNFYIVLNILVLIMTFRDKAYAFIVIYFILILVEKIRNKNLKIISLFLLCYVGFMLLLLLSYDKLNQSYLVYGTSTARGALYLYGLKYSLISFPFGTGFATWGGSAAAEFYSYLYYQSNMEFIPGITPTDISYATDTFWPFIYTQFGIISFFIYIYILYTMFSFIYKNSNKEDKLIVILITAYALIASLFEGFFTNDSGVYTIIIILILFGGYYERSNLF